MSITKRSKIKSGKKVTVYRVEVYVRGVRLANQCFDTKAQALAWQEAQRNSLSRNPSSLISQKMGFLECLEEYKAFAEVRLRASTFQNYLTRWKYLTESPLAKFRVSEINADTLDLWLEWLIKQETATRKKRGSFAKEVELLSVVFNWYRNFKDANFVVPVTRRHRERAIYKPLRKRRPDYFARPEEIRDWLLWLSNHRAPVYANIATFMILTGCRIGEAAALQWDMVDLERRIVRITRSVFWDHHTKRPTIVDAVKTEESARLVILPEVLVLRLRELKSQSENQPLVFPNQKGEVLKYNAIQSSFNAGFVALGLPWRSTHICRHTYATMALFATKDIAAVQASLGHKKREMTEKYAKAVAMLSSGTAEKTAAAFDLPMDHAKITPTIGWSKK